MMTDPYRLKSCKFEREPRFFVDIGANLGWWSRLAHDQYPEVKIYAYELIQSNVDFAKENTIKGIDAIELSQAAVIGNNRALATWVHNSNLGGSKPLYEGSDSGVSRENFKWNATDATVVESAPLNQISLAEIIENNNIDYIDFLKMDCEGSEYEIFHQIFDLGLEKRILNLAMEVHQRHELEVKEDGHVARAHPPVETQQYKSLKEECTARFDSASFNGGLAYLKNNLGEKDG